MTLGKAPSVISDQSAQAKAEEATGESLLDAQTQVQISPIANELQKKSNAASKKKQQKASGLDTPGEYREFKLAIAELLDQCMQDLDETLDTVGFELHPFNVNK